MHHRSLCREESGENTPYGNAGSGNIPFEMKPISGFIVTTSISIRSNTACVPHPDTGLIRRFTGLSGKADTNSSGAVNNPRQELKGFWESSAGKRCVEKRDAPYRLPGIERVSAKLE